VAEKRESQDLCFLAGTSGPAFLRRHGELRPRAGQVVDASGRVLGSHDGQHRFTVGQRRGIGVSSPSPLYVIAKDADSGRVTVGPRAALRQTRVEVGGATLYRHSAEVDSVKLRYRSQPVPCRVAGDAPAGRHARLALELATAVEGVAPGQVACLLRDDVVMGFATIRPSAPAGVAPATTKEEPVV
jgi:tRNA-specific 2-thiouridylase